MKNCSPLRLGSALVLGFGLGLIGCARAPSEAPPAAPVTVTVSYPVERDVTDYADFTARTAAVDSVEMRARVWGYLDKVNFKEGTLVKKGDVLFEIDPRTYQAALKQAEGNLLSMEARFERQTADLSRAQRLLSKRTISQEEFDKTTGDRGETAASLHDVTGLHSRRVPAGDRAGGRGRDAPPPGHRGLLRHDRRDPVRHLLDPGVLLCCPLAQRAREASS